MNQMEKNNNNKNKKKNNNSSNSLADGRRQKSEFWLYGNEHSSLLIVFC